MSKVTDTILGRLGLTTSAAHEREVQAIAEKLDTVRSTHAGTRAERDRAWTFILAAKREGLLPKGEWTRRANSFTASESEGDIEDDRHTADALRALLGASLPLHRTAANLGVICSTCDGGGCPDCTDPA